MLPARPGWGPKNDSENDENPYKTCRFLTFLVILVTLTKTTSELKFWPRTLEFWPPGEEGGGVSLEGLLYYVKALTLSCQAPCINITEQ